MSKLLSYFVHKPYSNRNLFTCNASLKSKGGSSSDSWMRRHVSDPYVIKAGQESYRARSAYKLIEINKTARILKPGVTVVECGAAPGAWTQVATKLVTNSGLVVACDLLDIEPVPGAVVLPNRDFTKVDTWREIRSELGDRRIDVVLSDMAPNVSGNYSLDHEAIIHLVYTVIKFSLHNAAQGSHLLTKTFVGANHSKLIKDLELCYENVKIFKPKSSRTESAETFICAKYLKKGQN